MKQLVFSVNEIFGPTIQGEGLLAGMPTTFVRLNGCDFRCSWCDSLDAVLPDRIKNHTKLMTPREIVDEVIQIDGRVSQLVTLSGGNPCIYRNLDVLIDMFHGGSFSVAVETQGSIAQDWLGMCDFVTFSPKPPSSGMKTNFDHLDECVYRCSTASQVSFKVVVFDKADLDFAATCFARYNQFPCFIQVGTVGKGLNMQVNDQPSLHTMVSDYQKIAGWVLADDRFAGVRVLPQLHLYLFGHGRGV